jgi:hypothetical protein
MDDLFTGTRRAIKLSLAALTLVLTLTAGSCGGSSGTVTPLAPTTPSTVDPTQPGTTVTPPVQPAAAELAANAQGWEIGPIIDGENYSSGTPLHPMQTSEGWTFDFPLSPNSVHYVTYKFGSLSGKTHIVMKYRIEMDQGVELLPITEPALQSIGPTLYFQRSHDDWNTNSYRWWDTPDAVYPMVAGEFQVDIPFDGRWTDVMGKKAAADPSAFQSALAKADRVGFTFGGGTGYGHGVFATGAARFTLLSFKVE